MEFVWYGIFAAVIYWGWKSIPPERDEIIAARESYGKVDDKV